MTTRKRIKIGVRLLIQYMKSSTLIYMFYIVYIGQNMNFISRRKIIILIICNPLNDNDLNTCNLY